MSRVRRFAPVAALAALAVLVALPAPARAGNDGRVPDHDRTQTGIGTSKARIDEKIGAQVPLDAAFVDEDGNEVTLGDCIAGKPTILVPVYYRCPMLCNQVLNGLLDAIRAMPPSYSVGSQFRIVCVSMDPKETRDLAHKKKDTYVGEYGRAGAAEGWKFLTTRHDGKDKGATVAALLDTVGFRYEFDKMLKEYDHPSGLIVLSPKGTVTRYFYGIGFKGEQELDGDPIRQPDGSYLQPSTTLQLSLIEANDGKGGSLKNKLQMLCYRYDALNKGYSLSVMNVVRLGGVVTFVLVVAGVLFALKREKMLGLFLKDSAPYMIGLVILPFFLLAGFVALKPDTALVQAPRLLVPYYLLACAALYAWGRSRARAAAAATTQPLPPEGTA